MYELKFADLECEYKFMISERLYSIIESEYEWQEEYEQVNFYYLDKECKLIDNDVTVRVRKKGGEYTLQVKSPVTTSGNLVSKIEHKSRLKCIPNEICGMDVSKICGIDVSDLYLVGELTTFRKTFKFSPHAKICLDLNTYCGIKDYEIEIETKGECNIRHFLDRYFLNDKPKSVKSKFARFIEKRNFGVVANE